MNFMFLNRYNDGGKTTPICINLEYLSYFYPWNGQNKGTYIILGDGSGIVVKESFDDIVGMLKGETK